MNEVMRLWSYQDVARCLGCCVKHVRDAYVKTGLLKSVLVGRLVRFLPSDVEDLIRGLRGNRVAGTPGGFCEAAGDASAPELAPGVLALPQNPPDRERQGIKPPPGANSGADTPADASRPGRRSGGFSRRVVACIETVTGSSTRERERSL